MEDGRDSRTGPRDGSAALIPAARAGDRQALGRLLEPHRPYLRLLARTSLADALGAKVDDSDLAQETLLKAHERFGQFRGDTERELAAWLRRILQRNLVDVVRRYELNAARRLGRERSLETSLRRSSLALGKLVVAEATSPSRAAEKRERGVLLAEALSELEPDDREVIVLRSLEERDWAEVGRRMSRSPEAARKLWGRALERLHPVLQRKM